MQALHAAVTANCHVNCRCHWDSGLTLLTAAATHQQWDAGYQGQNGGDQWWMAR